MFTPEEQKVIDDFRQLMVSHIKCVNKKNTPITSADIYIYSDGSGGLTIDSDCDQPVTIGFPPLIPIELFSIDVMLYQWGKYWASDVSRNGIVVKRIYNGETDIYVVTDSIETIQNKWQSSSFDDIYNFLDEYMTSCFLVF